MKASLRQLSIMLTIVMVILMPVLLSGQIEEGPDGTATETSELPKNPPASSENEPEKPATELVQNADTKVLEDALAIYNKKYVPPDFPITSIHEKSLYMLVRRELITRTDIEKFKDMVYVDGKVYERQEVKPEEDNQLDIEDEPPEQAPSPEASSQNNLMGLLDTSSQYMLQQQTRGQAAGVPIRAAPYEYRNESFWLKNLQIIYAVPLLPMAKPLEIPGKPAENPDDYLSTLDQKR